MNKVNFYYVAVLLEQLYGISIDTENLEELGLIAWELIGNKDTTKSSKGKIPFNIYSLITANLISTISCSSCSLDIDIFQ